MKYLMSDGSISSESNVGTGVKNPMITNLNANNYSLTNVGTINNFDIGTIDSDLTIVKDKTFHIRFPTTLEGTVFNNNVYAKVKNFNDNFTSKTLFFLQIWGTFKKLTLLHMLETFFKWPDVLLNN